MTHQDAPAYAGKHASGEKPDPAIAQAVRKLVTGTEVTCVQAFEVSDELMREPGEVGKNLDLLNLKLVKCQLGLFGYSPKKSIVRPAEKVSDKLKAAIENRLVEGRLSCADAWAIADQFRLKKMDVSSAAEALKIPIKPCQLGAF